MTNEKNENKIDRTIDRGGRQMRITPEEMRLIRSTFRNNEMLLKLLRKIFLPELDPEAPLGEMIDLWMTIPINQLTPEQAMVNILARNSLIVHLDRSLMQLEILANMDDERPSGKNTK